MDIEKIKEKLRPGLNSVSIFLVNVLKKIVESLVSVKIWLIVVIFFYSKDLLERGKINGDNFTAIIASLVSVIVLIRGATKISSMFIEAKKLINGEKVNNVNVNEDEDSGIISSISTTKVDINVNKNMESTI